MTTRRRVVSMSKFGELLLTREKARLVSSKLPIATVLLLKFRGVEVASPSFLDEIIRVMLSRGVEEIQFDDFNRQTARNIDRVLDARAAEEMRAAEALVS